MIGMAVDSGNLDAKLELIGHLLKATPIAEQLHMQIEGGNNRTFAETLRQVVRQLTPQPNYLTRCCWSGADCVYLGEFRNVPSATVNDLYWCSWSNLPIVRYGDGDYDYVSGYGHTLPAMVEAERRIKLAGLRK